MAVEKEAAGIARGLQNAEAQAAGASGGLCRHTSGCICVRHGPPHIKSVIVPYEARHSEALLHGLLVLSGLSPHFRRQLPHGKQALCCMFAGLQQLFSERNLPPLAVGTSLMLFQQITGQPSVLYYAAKIFKAAGFASDADATKVSAVLGLFKLIATGEQARMQHIGDMHQSRR